MRIVHVFKDFYPPLAAGITCYIADLSDDMALRGHNVQVHVAGVRRSRRDHLPSGVVVHRHRELARALSMPLSPGLVREVRGLDADIIHVHLPNPIGELGVVLNGQVPVVCSFHAQLGKQRALEPFYRPLRERLLGRAASILVSGEAMALVPELARHGDKIQVLPYGVSPRLTRPSRPRTSVEVGSLRLLFVGRLVYYKGLDVLLRALAGVTEVELRIVGDGPERAALEQQAADLGLTDRVRFAGSISDIELTDAYNTSDAIVLPSVSRAEAFGMAMAEAMSNGLPAISTALGTETDWVNIDQVTGFVVPAGSIAALMGAIDQLRDPGRRRLLGLAARERATSLFLFGNHADTVEQIYVRATS